MFCSNCGKELNPDFKCCPYCGQQIGFESIVKEENNDSDSSWWTVLGFFVPIAGLILFLVWEKERPMTAKKCGKGALISVIISASISLICFIVMMIFMIIELVLYSPIVTFLF